MPLNAPNKPPRMRLCILYQYVFLPRLRTASSSSRMPLTTRPHGLRMRRNVIKQHSSTTIQPTMITQVSSRLYLKIQKPYSEPCSGLISKNRPVKFCKPSVPPRVDVNRTERTVSRTISARSNGHDREVVGSQAQGRETQEQGQDHRSEETEEQPGPERQAVRRHGDCNAVCPGRCECGLSEVEQTRCSRTEC